MKKLFLILCIVYSTSAMAQFELSTAQNASRWRVGGNIGLNLGNNGYFGVSIAPSIGYAFNSYLEGGLNVGYQYSKWEHAKQNLFSAGPYLNFYPINNLFLRAHYAYFTGNRKYDNNQSYTFDENALWLGAGYRSGRGPIHFYAGLMYNVLYDESNSIFANGLRPIAGISIGI